jgi:endonuclease YncB( thermonuclease family)
MADAFFTTNGNVWAIGSIRRGANGQPQSPEASIPDGDTAGIHIEGSGSVRFLGVDTPEKNFSLAGSSAQRRLDSAMPHMSPIAPENSPAPERCSGVRRTMRLS